MILTKTNTKTEIREFLDAVSAEEISLGTKAKYRVSYDINGNISMIETDNTALKSWASSKGLT